MPAANCASRWWRVEGFGRQVLLNRDPLLGRSQGRTSQRVHDAVDETSAVVRHDVQAIGCAGGCGMNVSTGRQKSRPEPPRRTLLARTEVLALTETGLSENCETLSDPFGSTLV